MNLDIATDGTRLTLAVEIKPELRQASEADMPPDVAPAAMGFLPGDGDEYVLTEGTLAGSAASSPATPPVASPGSTWVAASSTGPPSS
ncbi:MULTISPECIES: hypothetical protein [unclassified Streptomyces]|uniref:hypothetical protein n=1 Tax=unclassified Streptomyces TaxID=2593676 RepID=UPI002E3409BE|nr:hypothetical protein [Streptomyces sp. NBC_01268]